MGAAAARHLAAEGAEVVGVVAADRFDGEAQRCQSLYYQTGLVMAGEEGDMPRQGLGGMMPMGARAADMAMIPAEDDAGIFTSRSYSQK